MQSYIFLTTQQVNMISFLQNKPNRISIYQYLHDKTFQIITTHTEILVFFHRHETFENLSTGNAHALKACTSTYYWKRFHNPLYAFYKLSKRQADHCENRPYPFRRRQTRKNEISHIGLLSQYNLYPSFVHTLTDEKAIEPHTVHRHVSFIPEFGDILISISVTRTAPNKRKKRGKGLVSFPKQDIFTSISVHTRSNKRRKKIFLPAIEKSLS